MGSKRWCFTNRTCTYTHTQVLTLVLTKAECKMSRVRARLCHPPVNPLPAGASLTCCTGWWKTHCFTYSRGLCLRVCLCCSLKLPLFHVGVVSCVHKTLRCASPPLPTPPSRLSTTSHLSFSLLLSLPPFPELANQIQYSIMQDLQQGESWENGKMPHSRLLLNYQLRQI